MNSGPIDAQPRIADLEKWVIRVFVIKELIALFKNDQTVLWFLRMLDAAIAVFCPSNMNNSAIIGKKRGGAKKKEKGKKEVAIHLTSA
jgi:hypothetical protein